MDGGAKSRHTIAVHVFDAPTPVPARLSPHERECAVLALREELAAGRISLDTFAERVDGAFSARTRQQLDSLRADLPTGVRVWLLAKVRSASAFLGEVGAHWRDARVPRLMLPTLEKELIVGRSPQCDCMLSDETVSRQHAAIRWTGSSWLIRDLGSLNGTRVNGSRVLHQMEVVPGDRISFGEARYRCALTHRHSAGEVRD